MGSMMGGDVMCGVAMMIGMGLVALLLVLTLALTAAAAVKYLRAGTPGGGRELSFDHRTGDR